MHQVPDVLKRALLSELGRVVLAVVEEAFLPSHVADRRLGDLHALEATRDLHVENGIAAGRSLGC